MRAIAHGAWNIMIDGGPMLQSKIAPISIITTVYARTDVSLFEETVASVRRQSVQPYEWLVLAHGPISDGLRQVLESLSLSGLLRLLVLPDNLGIQGGLRYCLENAAGDYILPLDADDLLSDVAIQTLNNAAHEHDECKIFYSDEDLLIGGVRHHAFRRPQHDPIHLRAHSFVWHCIMFSRQCALEIGVFTNGASEYAQDWDTLLRFEFNGMSARLVPKVLYHWRQHESSLSNSGTLFEGSLRSVRSCLEFVRSNFSRPENYEVQEYPIGRKGAEFYLRRKSSDLPHVTIINFSTGEYESEPSTLDGIIESSSHITINRGADGIDAIRKLLSTVDAAFLIVRNTAVRVDEEIGFWQAIKHFESSNRVVMVSGVLSDQLGRVSRGCPVETDTGFVDPLRGRSAIGVNRSMFNVWKAHCVDAPNFDFCVVRAEFLKSVVEDCYRNFPSRGLNWLCAQYAKRVEALLVFEPLLTGYVSDNDLLLTDEIDCFGRFEKGFLSPSSPQDPIYRGLSRLLMTEEGTDD